MVEAPLQIPFISEQITPPASPPAQLPAVPPPVKQVQIGAFSTQVAQIPQTTLHVQSGSAGFDEISSPGVTVVARHIMTGSAFDAAATAAGGPVRRVATEGTFDAAAGAGQQPYRRSIRAGGFPDATITQVSATLKPSRSTGSLFRPVEILEKPKPAYTEEARRLGVEGEVVFEALFTSAGQIRVLKTVRGLGHGLDEAALRAAEAIRFRPAERDGQPVDFTAAVHIIFQLAN